MITKAQVLSTVNASLSRSETNIDEQVRATLFEISSRDDFLTREAIRNTTVGEYIYTLPDDFKDMSIIKLDDKEPLQRITFETLQKHHADTESKSEPEYYALKNNYLWFDVLTDAVYEMRMWYSIYHPENIETILFPEEFREAINEGTIARICQKFEDWQGVKAHLELFEKQILIRKNALEKTLHFQKYNDL